MAITTSSGMRTTSSVNQDLKFRDVQKQIMMIKPYRTPFLSLSMKLGMKETSSLKYEFAEDDYLAKTATTSGSHNDSVTTIQLAAGHAARIKANAQLLNKSTDEVFRVLTSNAGNDTITVATRPAAGSTAASITAGEVLVITTRGAGEEGTRISSPLSTNPDLLFNYVEEFETPIEMSWWQQVTADFTEDDWPRQVRKNAEEHKEEIEAALWFGARELVAAGALEGRKVLYTGGIYFFIKNNAPAANILDLNNGVLSKAVFDEQMEVYFRAGNPNRKVIFTSPAMKLKIARLAEGTVQTTRSEKTLGIDITQMSVLGYNLPIITSQLFVDLGMTNIMFIVDMEYAKVRYLKGKGRTKVLTNVQENDRKSQKNAYHSIMGLELQNTQAHGLIHDIRP